MNKDIRVLLAEDEETLAMIIKDTLDDNGFRIVHTTNGKDALRLFFEIKPDILVSDVMMPEMDGFELGSKIREMDKKTPILFLTARSAVKDVVAGFELGGNDYLKKPFNMQELMIRIKALVGRSVIQHKEETLLSLGLYTLDTVSHKLTVAEHEQELSYRESELLKRLVINRNEVVTMQSILMELWGDDSFFNSRSLHVFVTKLRHKLAEDERIKIVNIRGVGYKLFVE